MYLEMATLVHKLLQVLRCQLSFATRVEEKSSNFMMPHSPHFFGSERASHLTQENILPDCLPFQRNLQHRVCILESMPLGIHANDIQYTGVASNTTFMRVNMPALDKYL